MASGQHLNFDPLRFVTIAKHGPMPEGERHQRIARSAYLKAESRGFVAGHELEDWLEAEAEIDQT